MENNITPKPEEMDEYALKIYRDNQNVLDFSMKKGYRRGYEEGYKEGYEDGRKLAYEKSRRNTAEKIAKRMKSIGHEMETIKQVTGLTEEEIETI